jgi:hypothetical protein
MSTVLTTRTLGDAGDRAEAIIRARDAGLGAQ